eukprot:6019413-Amphidinium_carterae.1
MSCEQPEHCSSGFVRQHSASAGSAIRLPVIATPLKIHAHKLSAGVQHAYRIAKPAPRNSNLL